MPDKIDEKLPHPLEEYNYDNSDDGICKTCDGTGEHYGQLCRGCGGKGYLVP